jgi:hypothetical protein
MAASRWWTCNTYNGIVYMCGAIACSSMACSRDDAMVPSFRSEVHTAWAELRSNMACHLEFGAGVLTLCHIADTSESVLLSGGASITKNRQRKRMQASRSSLAMLAQAGSRTHGEREGKHGAAPQAHGAPRSRSSHGRTANSYRQKQRSGPSQRPMLPAGI